jgi:ribosomal protein S6--L-glutamate ligase
MEINSTPGLKGIEDASKKNIAQSIITYVERNKR